MNLRKRGWTNYCWLPILVLLLVAGCSNTEPEGIVPENKPPVVNIVNIPPNQSFFTQNPEVFWFGTDIDGYIIAYEYLVVRSDTLQALGVDPYSESELLDFSVSGTFEWLRIEVEQVEGSPTRQRIKLFAEEDPDSAVEQAFFVRAVDDDSARSVADVRLYSRSNNPPDTKISLGGESIEFWDLPDTTASYKGITIKWEGSDDLDFGGVGGEEPTFEYYFQLFGPYDYLDTTDLLGTIDTLDQSKLIMTSIDTATNSEWLTADQVTVFDLFRNEPVVDTTRSGWFVAKSTARDDAFVPDPSPAFVAFKAVQPKFENELIVNLTISWATANAFIVGAMNLDERMIMPGGTDTVTVFPVDSVTAYAREIFEAAGYGDALFFTPQDALITPTRELLARYRNYVLLDAGPSEGRREKTFTTTHFDVLAEYMDLGGNVWVWAPVPFAAFATTQTAKLVGFTAQDMPTRYFDVKGMYVPKWSDLYAAWASQFACDPDTCWAPPPNDQLVRALAIQGKGFDDLVFDLERTWPYIVKREYEYQYAGAPGTAYFARDLFSEPLFLIDSYYGDFVPDSLREYIESLQGRVCGLRYDARTFRSAVFGFSWWLLPKDQAVGVVEKMMAWFEEE